MFQIRFIKLKIEMEVLQNGKLPKDKSSGIRGVMGQALQANTCVSNRKCENCSFCDSCIFYNVFHSQFRVQPYFTFSNDSVGYIIDCPDTKEYYRAGEYLKIFITLFGDTIPYFSPLIHAFSVIEIKGLGKNHIPLRLCAVKNRKGIPILERMNVNMNAFQTEKLSDYIEERRQYLNKVQTIYLESPCSVQVNHVICQSVTAEQLIKNLLRRLYMFNCCEGNYMEPYYQVEGIGQTLSGNFQEKKIFRYSNRQKQYIELKGIHGTIETEPIRGEAMDVLLAGEIIHVGKNTSFGFGKIRIK